MCPILSAHFACIARINLPFVAFHLQPQLRLQRMHFECSILAVPNSLNTQHTSTTTTTIWSECAYTFRIDKLNLRKINGCYSRVWWLIGDYNNSTKHVAIFTIECMVQLLCLHSTAAKKLPISWCTPVKMSKMWTKQLNWRRREVQPKYWPTNVNIEHCTSTGLDANYRC